MLSKLDPDRTRFPHHTSTKSGQSDTGINLKAQRSFSPLPAWAALCIHGSCIASAEFQSADRTYNGEANFEFGQSRVP